MSKTNPTPAELEAARQLLNQHAAQEAASQREAIRAALEPFTAVGFGSEGPLTVSLTDAARIMRENMASLGAVDPSLQNLAFSGAQVLTTFQDRIRSLALQNAEPEAPASETEGEG